MLEKSIKTDILLNEVAERGFVPIELDITKMEQIDHVLLTLLHFKGGMECSYLSDKTMVHTNGMDVVLSRGDDNNAVDRFELLNKMMDLIDEFELLEIEYGDATGFKEAVKRGDILLKFRDNLCYE
ncbi:MAG: hypothetical protein ACRC0G_05965 [Fusobacteriaceae bacterium]